MPPLPILQASPSALPSTPSISLLPFSLPSSVSGPQPSLKRFFRPRPYPSTTSPTTSPNDPEHRQASFRGRRIVSSFLAVPQGYQGVVLSSPSLASAPTTSADAQQQDEADEQKEEREERAAKRAKKAADAAAALGAEGEGRRRGSPKKAAAKARERAVEAAKKRAATKGKGKKKGFMLESDEEEEEQEEEMKEGEKEEEERKEDTVETVQVELPVEEVLPVPSIAAAEKVDVDVDVAVEVQEDLTASTTTAEVIAVDPSSSTSPPSPHAPPPSLPSLTSTPLPTPSLSEPSCAFEAELAKDLLPLRPVLTFEKLEIWNPDFPVAGGRVEEEDEVGRVVGEWVGVARAAALSIGEAGRQLIPVQFA
ncbi:hypothetical protein JCM8547_007255 [Rhodosporidiobolus lusitaniae]